MSRWTKVGSVNLVLLLREANLADCISKVQTVSSDFTTTDVTVDLFYTDFETFTTTDATVFATEVDVEQFTTTDASECCFLYGRARVWGAYLQNF